MPAALPRRALVARIVTLRRLLDEVERQAVFDGGPALTSTAPIRAELATLTAALGDLDGTPGRAA